MTEDKIEYRIALTKEDLDKVFKVRFDVFCTEFNYLDSSKYIAGRESDSFDTLDTTTSFIALREGNGIATVRLLEPNREVAERHGWVLGVDMEKYFDLSSLRGLNVAEIPRSSVIKDYRGTKVMHDLWKCTVQYAKPRGVTHFCASSNIETDDHIEAMIIYTLLSRQGLVEDGLNISPLTPCVNDGPSRYSIYPSELKAGISGESDIQMLDLDKFKVPGILRLYLNKLGLRCAGKPVFDPKFRMYVIPIIYDLNSEGAKRNFYAPNAVVEDGRFIFGD